MSSLPSGPQTGSAPPPSKPVNPKILPLDPLPLKPKVRWDWVTIITLVIAIVTLIFGDNLWDRWFPPPTPTHTMATPTTIVTLTPSLTPSAEVTFTLTPTQPTLVGTLETAVTLPIHCDADAGKPLLEGEFWAVDCDLQDMAQIQVDYLMGLSFSDLEKKTHDENQGGMTFSEWATVRNYDGEVYAEVVIKDQPLDIQSDFIAQFNGTILESTNRIAYAEGMVDTGSVQKWYGVLILARSPK